MDGVVADFARYIALEIEGLYFELHKTGNIIPLTFSGGDNGYEWYGLKDGEIIHCKKHMILIFVDSVSSYTTYISKTLLSTILINVIFVQKKYYEACLLEN